MKQSNKLWHAAAQLGLFSVLLASSQWAAAVGCTISSSGIAFGTYQPLTLSGKLASNAVLSNAVVSIVCSNQLSSGGYALALGESLAGSGDRILNRAMSNSNGGDNMLFNIYREPSLTTIWGNGTSGSLLTGVLASGSSTTLITVYGALSAAQNTLKAGSFSSTMVVTLSYAP